ncbi:porphobilinogen synthase [Corynebacterium suicordis]
MPSSDAFTPFRRPRRLRTNPVMRNFTAETDLNPNRFVLPMFIADRPDAAGAQPISSLPGVVQHTESTMLRAVEEAMEAGVGAIDLFGVPKEEDKDATGSAGIDAGGVLNRAIATVRREFGNEILVMADTCLDEFTDHGHCGVLGTDPLGEAIIDNDATLEAYAAMALAQADAGAHMVSPSGMMDGQVRRIRETLDAAGHQNVSIMAYSAKYASAFYGPFREAVGSSLQGDRRQYQQDARNVRESLLETQLDIDEGADIVMVKPGMPYLDVLRQVAEMSPAPVAAYQVSGEYAMISAAAEKGWIDLEPAIMESLTGFRRAGADIVLTYWATTAAKLLRQG